MPKTRKRRFPATWWHWVVVILGVLVLVAILQNLVTEIVKNDTHHEVTVSTTQAAPKAQVRGCKQRIEGVGGLINPDPQRDTVVGRAVWFLGARATYRTTPHESHQRMKVPVVVRSGAPVTLAVPPSERRWLHLEYLQSFRPTHAVTLKPCPHPATAEAQRRACHWAPYGGCRSGLTAFSGGFVLNFRRSPLQGRCETLQVWTGERTSPLTTRPFAKGGCGADGGAPTSPSSARHRPRVCFTTRSLHLDGGEALAAINQQGQGAVGTSLATIARQSFAPNIRVAIHRLEKFGGQDTRQVISAANRGLERVLQDPKLLLNEHTDQLHRAFSHAQRLVEQNGFSKPNCLY